MSYLDTAAEESLDAAVMAAAKRRWPEFRTLAIFRRGWGPYDDPGDELRALGYAGCSWGSKHGYLLLLQEVHPPELLPSGLFGLL